MGLLFSRTGRRILMAVAGLVIAMLVGLGMMVSSIAAMASVPGGSWGSGCTYDAGKAGELIITNTATGDEIHLGAGQMQNAATILKIAQELGLPMRASQIALMTGLQESKLKMLANTNVPESLTFPHEGTGHDHDSVNVFQQRGHWGAVAELMDIGYATRAFFGGPQGPNHGSPRGLLDVDDWQSMPLGAAAQAVQVSAFPDLYDGWSAGSQQIIQAISEAAVCEGPGAASSGSWVTPAVGNITDTFGRTTIDRPGGEAHKGTDIADGTCGQVITSAAAGTVIYAKEHLYRGFTVWIDHGESVTTGYFHMAAGSLLVKPGDVIPAGAPIGAMGNTGFSSGCHLHFQVEIGGQPVDPEPFMDERGATLGVPVLNGD